MTILATILGYVASLLLAISLMVNNDLKFRWLNTFGCLAFIGYGILIGAFPVILTNTLLLLINAVYLVKLYRSVETFDLIEFEGQESLVKKFLSFHQKDIQAYFPDFQMPVGETGYIRFVVLRDLVIANMFVARKDADGKAEVLFNYTVPKYRDYKVGRFIFEREKRILIQQGIRELYYTTVQNKNHAHFLTVKGFETTAADAQTIYRKVL
jgi:hypothetical protein